MRAAFITFMIALAAGTHVAFLHDHKEDTRTPDVGPAAGASLWYSRIDGDITYLNLGASWTR